MEFTAREKIIIKAASKNVEKIIKEAGDDFAQLTEKLEQAEKNLTSLFGDKAPVIMDGIVSGIEEKEALADMSNSGLLDPKFVQEAISEAIAEEFKNRKKDA